MYGSGPSRATDDILDEEIRRKRQFASAAIGAHNSAVECHLHTVEVVGSNPAVPTIESTT